MAHTGLNPDRLLPADPTTRAIAREIYGAVHSLPIISPHGHVPPEWLARDTPFADPTSLLLSPDHYIFRMLHAAGVPLAELGVGSAELDESGARRAWAHLCRHWDLFLGTPVRYWLEDELVGIFGVTEPLSEETADDSYDRIAEVIAGEDFRPRALMDRFGISVLATTDDPCDDLSHHAALAADDSFGPRVLPTFRPDKYLEPGRADFADLVGRLAEVSGEDTGEDIPHGTAHLVHGSSEGRFTITYAPGGLSREEIESVGYGYLSLEEALERYNPDVMKDGWNEMPDGERVFYISTPSAGLWATREKLGDR